MRALVLVLALGVCLVAAKRKENQEDFEFEEEDKGKDGKGGLVWILDPENELCSLLRCGSEGLCLLQDRFTAVCVNKEEAARYGDRIIPVKDANNLNNLSPFSSKSSSSSSASARKTSDDFGDDDYDDDDEYLLEDDDDDDDLMMMDDEERRIQDGEGQSQEDEGRSERRNGRDSTEVPKLNREPFARKQCSSCPVVRPVFLCGSDNKTYSSLCRLKYHNCLHDASVTISCKGFCPCKYQTTRTTNKERKRQRLNAYVTKLRSSVTEEGSAITTSPPINDEGIEPNLKMRDGDRKKAHYARAKTFKKFSKSKGGKGKGKYSKHFQKYKGGFKNSDKYWGKQQKNRKNDVVTNTIWGSNVCSQDALEAMGNRMLDWFSVIMADSRRRPANPQPGPSWCKREVSWMLGHLDQNNDQMLDVKELYRLEHDDREKCIKPFIDRCDMDRDLYLSGKEWCKCFDRSQRPCSALRKASKDLLGGYIPECDSEGYYRSTQCHVSAAMCWCVDKHGVEVPGSRTSGTPNCEATPNGRQYSTNHVDEDAENDDSDDTESYEGSADMPLDI